jgi:hypothetical protein
MLQDVTENAEIYLANARLSDPQRYAQLVINHGSEENANTVLLSSLTSRVLNGQIQRAPNSVFHHMLKSGVYKEHIRNIDGMNWTWLRSKVDFVIGDNPFCRSQRGFNNVNYPLGRKDLEVTFPIGRRLCLWMHRQKKQPSVMDIRDGRVLELNRRQIDGSHAFVWGPSEEALKPPPRK